MTAPPTIDTLEVLDAAHKMFSRALEVDQRDHEESLRLGHIANAGFSAVIPYIRNRTAPVQKKHHTAMLALMDEAGKL